MYSLGVFYEMKTSGAHRAWVCPTGHNSSPQTFMARIKATAHRGGTKAPRRVFTQQPGCGSAPTPKPTDNQPFGTARKGRKRAPRPGTTILRDIARYQRSTHLLIPRAPFLRVVRDLAANLAPDLRFQVGAVEALREASEAYLVQWLAATNAAAEHTGRITICVADVDLVHRISRRPAP